MKSTITSLAVSSAAISGAYAAGAPRRMRVNNQKRHQSESAVSVKSEELYDPFLGLQEEVEERHHRNMQTEMSVPEDDATNVMQTEMSVPEDDASSTDASSADADTFPTYAPTGSPPTYAPTSAKEDFSAAKTTLDNAASDVTGTAALFFLGAAGIWANMN